MPRFASLLALCACACACACVFAFGTLAKAETQPQERRPSHCIALVENTPGIRVHRASFAEALGEYTIGIHYIGHAMFLIATPGGTTVVTDYSGFLGASDFVPDVATMNRAHSTHWTPYPDPRIPHVLPGWGKDGAPAGHYLDLGDMLIRSVSTDIRSWGAEGVNGNSIFVFEAEGLCIGHLGHLHHEPTAEQYAALGRLDVVMAPVDGGMTLDLPRMIGVLKRLRSSVVIPMHWFGTGSLAVFLDGMRDEFAIERVDGPSLMVSLRDLPDRPTIKLLRPQMLRSDDTP
ncbi:MAG: MBL fold metallo-hydrolase [Mangrovicoccus sp.]